MSDSLAVLHKACAPALQSCGILTADWLGDLDILWMLTAPSNLIADSNSGFLSAAAPDNTTHTAAISLCV